jgi:CHASE2 domain-containing sensor protein
VLGPGQTTVATGGVNSSEVKSPAVTVAGISLLLLAALLLAETAWQTLAVTKLFAESQPSSQIAAYGVFSAALAYGGVAAIRRWRRWRIWVGVLAWLMIFCIPDIFFEISTDRDRHALIPLIVGSVGLFLLWATRQDPSQDAAPEAMTVGTLFVVLALLLVLVLSGVLSEAPELIVLPLVFAGTGLVIALRLKGWHFIAGLLGWLMVSAAGIALLIIWDFGAGKPEWTEAGWSTTVVIILFGLGLYTLRAKRQEPKSVIDASRPGGRIAILTLSVFALTVSLAVSGALLTLSRHQLLLLAAPDRFTYDWRTALFSRVEPTTRRDIAFVLIGNRSLEQYAYQAPTDRGLLAQVIRALDAAGAKAIGLDFVFIRPTEKDDILIDAIRSSKAPVVLGAVDSRMTGIRPDNLAFQRAFVEKAGNPLVGHVYLQHSGLHLSDEVIRKLPLQSDNLLQSDDPDDIHRSFAETLVTASGREVHRVGDLIAWLEPRANNGAETFNLFDVPSHAPQDATSEVILPLVWRNSIRGRIVIVGGDFDARDRYLTPLSVSDNESYPSAWIQGQVVAQLIDGRSLRGLTNTQEFTLSFLLALIGFYLGWAFRLKDYAVFVYAASYFGLIAFGFWLFSEESVILPSDTTFYALIAGIAVGHYSRRGFVYGYKL